MDRRKGKSEEKNQHNSAHQSLNGELRTDKEEREVMGNRGKVKVNVKVKWALTFNQYTKKVTLVRSSDSERQCTHFH